MSVTPASLLIACCLLVTAAVSAPLKEPWVAAVTPGTKLSGTFENIQGLQLLQPYFEDPLSVLVKAGILNGPDASSVTNWLAQFHKAKLFKTESLSFSAEDDVTEQADLIIDDDCTREGVSTTLNWGLKAGGTLLCVNPNEPFASTMLSQVQTLNRNRANEDFRVLSHHADLVIKASLFTDNLILISKKGIQDDQDYMALGGSGVAYGEAQTGVVQRILFRQLRTAIPSKRKTFFERANAFLHVPLNRVFLTLRMKLKLAPSGNVTLTSFRKRKLRGKSKRGYRIWTMTRSQFEESLPRDLEYAMSVHRQRFKVVSIGPEAVVVEVLPHTHASLPKPLPDFKIHRRQIWSSFHGYFGKDAQPQPLSLVAQTFREKMTMYGDDLSDIYKGAVTRAAKEGKWRVEVQPSGTTEHNCKFLKDTGMLKMHHFSCHDPCPPTAARGKLCARELAPAEPVPPQSILYQLFAKEKLDGPYDLHKLSPGGLHEDNKAPALDVLTETSERIGVGPHEYPHEETARRRFRRPRSMSFKKQSAFMKKTVDRLLSKSSAYSEGVDYIIDYMAADDQTPPGTQLLMFTQLFQRVLKPGGVMQLDDIRGSFTEDGAIQDKSIVHFFQQASRILSSGANAASAAQIRSSVRAVIWSKNDINVIKRGTWAPSQRRKASNSKQQSKDEL